MWHFEWWRLPTDDDRIFLDECCLFSLYASKKHCSTDPFIFKNIFNYCKVSDDLDWDDCWQQKQYEGTPSHPFSPMADFT